jgi:hypothetical protein
MLTSELAKVGFALSVWCSTSGLVATRASTYFFLNARAFQARLRNCNDPLLIHKKRKLRDLIRRANYTFRASALSANLVPTFADRGCHVASVMDLYGRILAFLDRSRYFFFQVADQLHSRGWVDQVLDPLLLSKRGWICSQRLWPSDQRSGPLKPLWKSNSCLSRDR